MFSSHQYILHLIRSVQTTSCIWDDQSEFYHDKEYVAKSWELVTIEVGKYTETDEITVANVKQTWRSLLKAYNTCVSDGNPSNFMLFNDMKFLGDNGAWYHKPEDYFDDIESPESMMILLQVGLNLLAFVLFLCMVFYYSFTHHPSVLRETDLATIMIVSMAYFLLGFIPVYEGNYSKYYTRSNIRLARCLVAVPTGSFIVEKMFMLKLSTIKFPLNPIICFLLGTVSICAIVMTNQGYSCKKPFPPSKRSSSFHFGLSMVWTNVVCFILRTIEANSVFYVIPIWVVLNALWSYFFCYYLWMNVDSIFPNFNENPFEMTPRPNTPFHIEFKQKPREPVLEVE